MQNTEYAIAYKEVLEILKHIPKDEYDKIPDEKIKLFEEMQDKNYEFQYNPSKTLNEQKVSKRAKAIIYILFRDYWATDIQRKQIIDKQNYERNKLNEEKAKKYSPNNIFKNKKKGKT